MTTDIQVATISGTLASDPARWSEMIFVSTPEARMETEREIAATASAVLGKHARIILHHNTSGTWAVDIQRGEGKRVYHVHWSSVTTNIYGTALVPIHRGEALTTLLHELFHVLYTDWVERPDWCHPAHWQEFFGVLNMTEDIRIEDAGENEVPVFASLRKIENERLMSGNEGSYPSMSSIRHICLALYSSRCVGSLAPKFVSLLSEPERDAYDTCLADFHYACDQRSTQALLDNLKPLYDAMLPFLPPVGGTGGDQPGDDDSESGDGDEQQPGGGGDERGDDQQPGGSGDDDTEGDDEQPGGGGDTDSDGGDDSDGDGDDDATDDTPSDDEGGGSDDEGQHADSDDGTSDGGTTGGTGAPKDDIPDEPLRPDRARGSWDTPRRDTDNVTHDAVDLLIDGSFIKCHAVGNEPALRAATNVTSRMIRSQLNRVLQHNADGSYAGRKRRGSFDVNSARRLSLGDTRVFRTKQGPRGSRDFSLVVLLDASSSVRGACGTQIANAGYAVKRASEGVHGLDVAVAAYGGRGPIGAIPFDATDVQWDSLPAMCMGVATGSGGGTDETSAIIWARRASMKRGAEQPLIVVLTDGQPNDGASVRREVDEARRSGILTGGIGISRGSWGAVVPDYHEFYTTARDFAAIPSVLAELLRTMMKAR